MTGRRMTAIGAKRLRALLRFAVFGIAIGALVGAVIHLIEGGTAFPHFARGGLSGLLIGIGVGIGEEYVFIGRRRWRSYGAVTLLRVSCYALLIVAVLTVVNGASDWLVQRGTFVEASREYVLGPGASRDIVFALVVALLGTSYLEIRRLHNPGDIRRYLLGRYRYPEREVRVFLLADLEGSTALAERLGPELYSRMIGDCYRDMSEAILAWRGSVYQYVGDEIIVSWRFDAGVRRAACLRCFADMCRLLEKKSDRYEKLYGATPRFRAGLHGGAVMTTWIGLAKTELAFHGDALNAAARLQSLCKSAGERCVVSGPLLDEMPLPPRFGRRSLGRPDLRGKEDSFEVFAIDGVGLAPPPRGAKAVEPAPG